jgi:hypothetical protein
MLDRNPADRRAHFGLAAEFEKSQQWDLVISHLRAYLESADDQGNAWGRLARAQLATGDRPGAAESYRKGIDSANRHGHPSMASEFEDALYALET